MSGFAGQGPLEIFQAGEEELLDRATKYRRASEYEHSVEATLRVARSITNNASRAVNEHGGALLERIHGSVTPDTDPGEYLAAILNTYHSGQRIGDDAVLRLAPMRMQIRQKPIPIGIVGSTMGQVSFGLSAGDIKVRRSREYETGFDTFAGIRLELPLSRWSSYSGGTMFSSDNRWLHSDHGDEPCDVGVVQWLSNLRLASTPAEIRALNDTPTAPYSPNDTVLHHEQRIKSHTGFVPFIAYGEAAVRGLLAALYEGRQINSPAKGPNSDDVLAAAISLDIAPEAIAAVDANELKGRLRGLFTSQIASNIRAAIRGEASRRRQYSGGFGPDWQITASPQVMKYAGVEQDEITDAIRDGIERSIDDMRVADEADRPSWIMEENEYRLLEDEARERAVVLIAARYGLIIDPAQLGSETLKRKLAARLEEKRGEQARHERYVHDHPWLSAHAVTE